MEYPGYEIATQALQYELHSHSGDKRQANYVKTVDAGPFNVNLSLTVYDNGRELLCEISTHYKMITITTGKIQFPHPRFAMFEHQVIECSPGE